MSENNFDLIVVGGGPGGYVCAIRAAQLGMNVACVEKRGSLGGTCLNVGCIPSKALLQSSHHYEAAAHEFASHGISTGKLSINVKEMIARKDKIVSELTQGIEYLFKKNKVTYIKGAGEITSADKVTVAPEKGKKQVLTAENIVIATGSEVTPLPGVEIDEKQIVSSTGALDITAVPKKMIVIGGGVIGLELGSVWRRLGAEVTVVEFLDSILPGMDGEVCKQMLRTLKKQGMNFKLGHKVTSAKKAKTGVTLTVEPKAGGDAETIKADTVLVSIGRRPYTQSLGLEKAGVEVDERGFVKVDHDLQTNVPGIFAIGDVIGGIMLAHKAEEEGVAVAEAIAGQSAHVNYDAIPGVVYTWPEVGVIGKSEESLKKDGIAYKKGKFPFTANSRAKSTSETEGFVKVLADAKTDRLLGVHIVGPIAGDLVMEAAVCMEFGGSAEDLARTCHAHPGYGEALKEAAMGVDGWSIHI
ncbi:MAG: dihydrolipoyl dehydrogenase [Rhodospirillales bacterium]|nr:dihydrolipoyl dehydrogenase [Rhodospirillales bacterium]